MGSCLLQAVLSTMLCKSLTTSAFLLSKNQDTSFSWQTSSKRFKFVRDANQSAAQSVASCSLVIGGSDPSTTVLRASAKAANALVHGFEIAAAATALKGALVGAGAARAASAAEPAAPAAAPRGSVPS